MKLDQGITKKQIQYLQVLRRREGIGDELYAEMKRSVGVESTRDLNVRQFEDLVRRITKTRLQKSRRASAADRRAPSPPSGGEGGVRGKTWKPVHSSARASGMHHAPPADKEKMLRKIEAILTECGLPWSYADGIAKQQTRGKIERLRFCDAGQTYKVLQSLCVYQGRKRAREALP